jgi:hypothetical protein
VTSCLRNGATRNRLIQLGVQFPSVCELRLLGGLLRRLRLRCLYLGRTATPILRVTPVRFNLVIGVAHLFWVAVGTRLRIGP